VPSPGNMILNPIPHDFTMVRESPAFNTGGGGEAAGTYVAAGADIVINNPAAFVYSVATVTYKVMRIAPTPAGGLSQTTAWTGIEIWEVNGASFPRFSPVSTGDTSSGFGVARIAQGASPHSIRFEVLDTPAVGDILGYFIWADITVSPGRAAA